MKHLKKLYTLVTMVLALVAAVSIAEVSHALPGPAPAETAIAEYDPTSGVLVVSVTNVSNWVISSASAGMTGPDDVTDVLPQAGGLVTNNIIRVGELKFGGDFSYTDVNLGAVALTNLSPGEGEPLLADFDNDNFGDGNDFLLWQTGFGDPYDATDLTNWNAEFGTEGGNPPDLTISWNAAGVEQPRQTQPVVYLSSLTANISAVPEPGSVVLWALAGLAILGRRRR